jgi:hypothetical protein
MVAGLTAILVTARLSAARAQEAAPPETGVAPPEENEEESGCPPGMVPAPEPACPPYAQQPYAQPYPQVRRHRPAFSPYMTSFTIGGGVGDFVRERISRNASTAGAWDARLLLGTRSPFSVEASYLGSAQRANDPIADRTITTTQVFGMARFNATLWRIQPYAGGGVGWANLHRYGNPFESPVAGTNFNHNVNSVMVPFAGGIATYFGHHGTLEARGEYHLITSKDFTPFGARPDMWFAELRVGYAF